MSTVKAKKQKKKAKKKHGKQKNNALTKQGDTSQKSASLTDSQHHTSSIVSTAPVPNVVSTDEKNIQSDTQPDTQPQANTLVDIPIIYEDITLFGKKAPLILLIAVMMTLLTSAFLKHQYTLSAHITRVTVTTDSSSTQTVDESVKQSTDTADSNITNTTPQTVPQDVIMLKLKEPTTGTETE